MQCEAEGSTCRGAEAAQEDIVEEVQLSPVVILRGSTDSLHPSQHLDIFHEKENVQ